jgi:hypothetical protein
VTVAWPQVFFSTGTLVAFATTDTPEAFDLPDEGVELALLQDVSIEYKWQDKALYGPCWVNSWPEEIALYNGAATIKATWAKFYAAALQLLLNAAKIGGDVNRVEKSVIPLPWFKVVFVGQTTDGDQVRLTFGKVSAPNLTIPFKREDFMMPNVELHALPDADDVISKEEFFFGAITE